jgi:thioredoxin 1
MPGTTPVVPSKVVVLDSGNFEALVLDAPRPGLVEFRSPTCPACQSMDAIVTQLAADFEGRALVGTVDVTRQPSLTSSYRVSAVPTFLFFKKGEEASRQVGATTYEDLAGQLRALVATP